MCAFGARLSALSYTAIRHAPLAGGGRGGKMGYLLLHTIHTAMHAALVEQWRTLLIELDAARGHFHAAHVSLLARIDAARVAGHGAETHLLASRSHDLDAHDAAAQAWFGAQRDGRVLPRASGTLLSAPPPHPI